MRTTQTQRRALDNLSRGLPINTGFKSCAFLHLMTQALRDKGLMDGAGITELGLTAIKAK
jgi:hypothetical protein